MMGRLKSDRRMFERVVEACIAAGLIGGEGFAVDANPIQADANKQRSMAGQARRWGEIWWALAACDRFP